MPNLLAISFERPLAPSFDLRCLRRDAPQGAMPDGWGIAYYPSGELFAPILKEPAPPHDSLRSELARVWEHLEAALFVVHVRRATWGAPTDANTQPFTRSYGGRDWILAHAGSLDGRLEIPASAFFQPVGATDSERVFCVLLERLNEAGYRSLDAVPRPELRGWLLELNQLGSLNLVLCDGRDLVVYADARAQGGLHLTELHPPYEGTVVLGDDDLGVDLTARGRPPYKGVVVASTPLEATGAPGAFRALAPGSLVVVRDGAIIDERTSDAVPPPPKAVVARARRRPSAAEPRRYLVRHKTVYRYAKPVERSSHVLRLFPVHDRLQSVVSSRVDVSVAGPSVEYEDVFGNRARRLELDQPYTELVFDAESVVDVLDTDPLRTVPLTRSRSTIPLVWMPWQRHMLEPYLLPPELPESQLRELARYAMSFVDRNDSDLVSTLLDMNATLFEEYAYAQGTTTLQTTAFEVFAHRRGVCQDFANLFICLARLLNVPARYVCGYVYTGPKAANPTQSEASHAWVQVYLPEVGWRGFDPTNGTLTQTEHVRVAVGRSYVDATPTSGTLYLGGGGETLEVQVNVEPIAR